MTRTIHDQSRAVPSAVIPHRMIRASAGAGKTFALSSRYLQLLSRGQKVDGILATTFTRKAAGEILDRVLVRLAGAARDETSAAILASQLGERTLTLARVREILGSVAGSLHRISIATLDAFFNRVAQSFRHELALPPQPKMVANDDPLATRLRAQAIAAMLGDEPVQVLVDLLRKLHHDQARRSVTQAIDDTVSKFYDVYRQAPERELWSRIEVPAGLLPESEFIAAVEALQETGDALPKTKTGQVNKRMAECWQKSVEAIRSRYWDSFLSDGLAANIAEGKETFGGVEIPAAVRDACEPLIAHAQAVVIARLCDANQAAHRLLQAFDVHYTRLRQAHRVMLFSDLAHKLARQLPRLGDDLLTEVYFRLDTAVSHLLLDEFQDTSLEQWQVLAPFAQEICATEETYGERSFFCVGDVKQAIYGWRGGCSQLFDHVESQLHLTEDHREKLARSYRSSQVLLDAVNTVFGTLGQSPTIAAQDQPQALAMSQCYEHHTANDAAKPGYVEIITSPAPVVDDGDENENGRGDAADSGEQQRDGFQSEGEDVGALGSVARADTHEAFAARRIAELAMAVPHASVGVLVSTNRAVNRLIFQLRQMGQDASGEGGSAVTDDPAVNTILAAIALADHPGDTAAAFLVHHSPLGAIVGLDSLLPSRIIEVTSQIRRDLLTRGYGPLVSHWARQLAPHSGARGVQRLIQLTELADRFGGDATLRPRHFCDVVAATPVEDPSPARIRIMTVHKAKGLEFDIVVLPELDRPLRDNEAIYVSRPDETAAIDGVFLSANKNLRRACGIVDKAYAQQRARRTWDNLCALYVAMTRPRSALHMILRPLKQTRSGKPATRGRCDGSYAAILRQALCVSGEVEETFAGDQTLFAAGDPDWFADGDPPGDSISTATTATATSSPTAATDQPQPLRIAMASASHSTRTWRVVSPSSLEAQGRVRGSDLLRLESASLQYGTLIHAWFAQVGWHDEAGVLDDEQLLAAGRAALPEASDDVIRQYLPKFRRMLNDPAVSRVLARPTGGGEVELWRERPFALRLGDRLLRGAFDRVVVTREAGAARAAALVDFKTDRIEPGGADLATVTERYRPQIHAYRSALAAMLAIPEASVTAHLLYVTSGDVVAV